MAQNVGTAYVELLPSARGFGKRVEGELNPAFDGVEKRASGRFSSMFKNVAKWGSIAVAGIGTAIVGLAIKGGISRALNIEDAQAKLKGLGHDVQSVEAIMGDALAAVKGTAFGLDEAVTAAATATAAGIKSGEELEGYLRLVADGATIAGTSISEMGAIMNKMTTAGKVYTMELNQLADRGLPVWQWLQEEYKVSAEELRKMVSRGEIDAVRFRKVMERNIGGAALASGDTTRGAFANMMAALSRLGVTLTSAIMPHMKTVFQGLTTVIDEVNNSIGPFAERVAAAFSARIGPALEAMPQKFTSAIAGVKSFFGQLQDGYRATIDVLSSGDTASMERVFGLSPDSPVFAVLGVLRDLFGQVADAAKAFWGGLMGDGGAAEGVAGIFEDIGFALYSLWSGFADSGIDFEQILGGIGPLLNPLLTVVKALLPALEPLLPVVFDLANMLGGALGDLLIIAGDLMGSLGPVVEALSGLVAGVLPPLVDVVMEVVEAILPLIPIATQLVQDLIPPLAGVLVTLTEALTPIISTVVSVVKSLTPLISIVGRLAQAVGQLLPPLVRLVDAALKPLLAVVGFLVEGLGWLVEKIVGFLMPAVDGIVSLVEIWVDVLAVVIGWLTSLYESIEGPVRGALDWLRGAVELVANAWGWVLEKGGEVLSWFGSLGGKLTGALKDIAETIAGPFIAAFNRVIEAWETMQSIINPGSLVDDIEGASGRIKERLSSPALDAGLGAAGRLTSSAGQVDPSAFAQNLSINFTGPIQGVSLEQIAKDKKRVADSTWAGVVPPALPVPGGAW